MYSLFTFNKSAFLQKIQQFCILYCTADIIFNPV
nr:MAG TPA: hypothetical protein [Caudoviricetes sp.]